MLPSVYALRSKGVVAEYEHLRLTEALSDFVLRLPNGVSDYYAEVSEMMMRLYTRMGGEAKYFLDKTPRYHLVLNELISAFPDAKFIFLWRNPLAVAASMMETWNYGKWNLHWFYIDLHSGLANLVKYYEKEQARVYALRYEDLVREPEIKCREIFNYLGLAYDVNIIQKFSEIKLDGKMGDSTGVNRYSNISADSLGKWRNVLSNPLRKSWARRYLKWIGHSRLESMGYRMHDLLNELDSASIGSKFIVSDLLRMSYARLYLLRRRRLFNYPSV